MRPSIALATVPLLIAGLILPAGAAEECRLIRGADTTDTADDVEACRQQVWFHQADTKAGNLAGTGLSQLPTFDTTAPSTSVAMGAGGGYAGSSLHQVSGDFDPTYTPAFEGTVDGALDNVLVDLYLFPLVSMAEGATGQGGTTFRVDANLYLGDVLIGSHGDLTVPLESGGDAVKRVRFTFANLYATAERRGLTGDDGPLPLRLEVVGTGIASNGAVWVYDTTEVPAGMIFNPTAEDLDDLPG